MLLKQSTLLFISLTLLFSCSKRKELEKKTIIDTNYDKAFDFREQGNTDSAFVYFNTAKDFFLLQKDSLGAGKCLVNMAKISTDNGDYFGGQELSLEAMSYLDSNNEAQHPYIVSNLNNLGISYYNLREYPRAIEFYQQSRKFTTDSVTLLGIQNNTANAYRRMHQYGKAVTIYQAILKNQLNPKEYARVLSNYKYTTWLENPKRNIAPDLIKTLHIRMQEKDQWGMNSSFAYLADFYEKKSPDSALYYAFKMYHTATALESPDDRIEALQKVIKLSPPNGAKPYFQVYQQLSDSLQTVRAAARNQFAVVRYESEYNKAENLKLQQENTEKEYQLIVRDLVILMVIILFIAVCFAAYFYYRKRRERIESEARKAIADSKLKTSKQVHDVVANGIYRVMTEIENQENIEKEEILDRLDNMYRQSRNISYEVEESIVVAPTLEERISGLIRSFQTKRTSLILKGNLKEIGQKVSLPIQDELEHILQELLVNMKKHSFATTVYIKFSQKDDRVTLEYTDNGIGMEEAVKFNNGLRNTGNRIELIHGEITFDTKMEKGLKIWVSFPVS